jgi:hypothetical protein
MFFVFQAANDISAGRAKLIELFSRVEYFFKRLDTYTAVPPTAAMTDIIVEIMVAVLSFLALATKEVKRGRICTSIHRIVVIVIDSPLVSKIYQEADGKQRCRGCATEAGQIDTGRGPDGRCRTYEDHPRR